MTIGEATRELRTHLGLTQEAFAREVGATLKTISRYENGGRPSRVYLQRLMIAAEKDRHDLYLVFRRHYKKDIEHVRKALPSAGTARRISVWELRELLSRLRKLRYDLEVLSQFIPANESETNVRIKNHVAELLDRIQPWLEE